MISNYMTQKDVIDELKERTGFYKHNIKDVLDALEDILIDHMNAAIFDEPSEMRLFHGWRIGAKRMPERTCRDPRNQKDVVVSERLIPYCTFKQSFKDKINEIECDEELLDDDE